MALPKSWRKYIHSKKALHIFRYWWNVTFFSLSDDYFHTTVNKTNLTNYNPGYATGHIPFMFRFTKRAAHTQGKERVQMSRFLIWQTLITDRSFFGGGGEGGLTTKQKGFIWDFILSWFCFSVCFSSLMQSYYPAC